MKKTTIKLGVLFSLFFGVNGVYAQGLEGIVVEKFYQTNAADEANALSNGAVTNLNPGTVVYRVYVNMAAGYKFSQVYGSAAHQLDFTTTTNFYNDPNSGSTTDPSSISTTNVRKNTALIDTWLTTGGAANGRLGVLKTEDSDGSPGNAQSVLQNNPGGLFGSPINIGNTTNAAAFDGMIPGTVVSPNVLGITAGDLAAFDQTPGNSFVSNDGAIAALGGVVGPTASNMVLIGQFTTDGVFGYHLNVQIVNIGTGIAENYVSSAPTGGELTDPSLSLVPNNPPSVSITNPTNGANIITGSAVTIAANAADTDGTVTQVEFFVDNVSIGTDATSPYTMPWTAVVGAHAIKAVATDNSTDATTSSIVNVSVANNQAPTATVSAAATAIAGDAVAITATGADVDGTVTQVEFFVDNVSIGVDLTSPYAFTWTAVAGNHGIRAVATDDLGLSGTSTTSNIAVAVNNPPTATITSPLATATYIAPAVVTITATATDADGTVTQVEFFVNGSSVGVDLTSPYSFDWTSVVGPASLTVRSTDNKGAITTSAPVLLNIADPFALPYEIETVRQQCNVPTFMIPVAAAVTTPVDNVKGYDVVLNYDNTMLTATGKVIVYPILIDSSLVETATAVDNAAGKITITLTFKGSAPTNTEFNGVGRLFGAEFTKTAAFDEVDSTVLDITFLQESYISGVQTKSVSNGKAVTFRDELFDGKLLFWSDNQAIKYDAGAPNSFLISTVKGGNPTTQVVNTAGPSVSPDLNGAFTYNLTNGLGINVTRDVDNVNSVQFIVNAADAVLGKTLLLNDISFMPNVYQMLALDVNLDGVVSAGDISQIKQRATLNIPEYKQAWNYTNAGVSNGEASKDWVFVDSVRVQTNANYQISATFPSNDGTGFSKARVPVVPFVLALPVSSYANCPVVNDERFKGVMLGDVNGSYASYTADGILKKDAHVVFDLAHAVESSEGTFDVPVMIETAEFTNALDFALQVKSDLVSSVEVINTVSGLDANSYFNTADQTMRFTGFNTKGLMQATELMTIRVTTTAEKLTPELFNAELTMLNGKQVKAAWAAASASITTEAMAELVQVYPNPTAGQLVVSSPEDAIVEITDISGAKVLDNQTITAQEKTQLNLNGLSNGTYIVRIYNANFNTMKRVVLVK